MLAVTPPASLVEATHQMNIRDHIIRHAELLYRHAESTVGVGPDESLYVITGCLKSDSWALAAYRRLFGDAQASTARLIHIGDAHVESGPSSLEGLQESHQDEIPIYDWKERGPTEAKRSHFVGQRLEDQTLFFRGFKVTFSRKFASEIRKEFTGSSNRPTSAAEGPTDGSHCLNSPRSDEGEGETHPSSGSSNHRNTRGEDGNDSNGWPPRLTPSEGADGGGSMQGNRLSGDSGLTGVGGQTNNKPPCHSPLPPDGMHIEACPKGSSEVGFVPLSKRSPSLNAFFDAWFTFKALSPVRLDQQIFT